MTNNETADRLALLRKVNDLLDGKITHVVAICYGEIEIIELVHGSSSLECRVVGAEAITWCITLPSGSATINHPCHPCCSLDEAKAKVSELIAEAIQSNRKAGWVGRLENAQSAANKYGIPFPEEADKAIATAKQNKLANEIKEMEEKIAESQSRLDDLRAKRK
jgi:hypothetical protein